MGCSLYISHDSALFYWRTNPIFYVLEGASRNIRSLQDCARTVKQFNAFDVPELEFGPDPVHILVPADTPRCPSRFKRHPQRSALPPHALYPIRDGIHVVSPELCLVQMCHALSFVQALEVGMELCGTYALRPDGIEGVAQRDYMLIDVASFARHTDTWKKLRGLPTARQIGQYLVNGSASPMETKTYLLLCLPLYYGGYNVTAPELNPKIELRPEEQLLLHRSYIKPDFLWRDERIIVEYDGRQHEEEGQSVYDEMRKVVLENRGYTVRQLKRRQLYNPLAFDSFATSLCKLLGQRRRKLSSRHQLARESLRAELLG